MSPSDREPDVPLVRIDGRYRVERALGQGGMARVYSVVDERSGQALALKLLGGGGSTALRAMFEREYHTLVQLAHPRIVRVFEYGIADEGPYYTMELLDGGDVRSIARARPLDPRETCVLLRDVASALALIHSRRLLHRDVSPRNVWCTADGRAKLIDFGTLVAMGPQTRCAGTPSFVPPEALYQQPLDARCDLYALGALGYYMLTRRHAYPVRDIAELPEQWQHRPKRPSAMRSEVPRALCDLVMSLLSLDARGRPSSAAEVCERLTAAADLPPDDERHLAQAFLTSPKLVGREAPAAELRARLLRLRRGRGGTRSIAAPAGLGRSRMLASFVLEAKLFGATTIALDAGAVGSEPFALAGALVERLLEALPLAAAAAVEVGPVLSHVSPAVHRAFGAPQLAELRSFDRTRKLTAALLALIAAAARRAMLVIAVDDVHRADAASIDALARLSLAADDQRLLLVTTCDEAALHGAPAPLAQLTAEAQRVALSPLDPAGTRELLCSLFGAAPNLEDVARWLHELSQGSPQACMQYAQYLVDRRLARYEGGRWQLPSNLRAQGLPATLDAMLEDRLASLGADARALLLGLALASDDTRAYWQPELHVRMEDFPTLLGLPADPAHAGDEIRTAGESGRTFAALDELLRAGLLQQRDAYYVIAQRATAEALLRIASDDERRIMHARLAQVFDNEAYLGRMLAVRQLQRAGKHERARERLGLFAAYVSGPSGSIDWRLMRVSVSSEATRAALEHWQAHGGSPREGILLRRLLLLTCSVYDWGLSRFGAAQIAQLRADCGLTYWDVTDPAQPAPERARDCMRRAWEEYERKPEAERGLDPDAALRELASCAIPLQGSFANMHDAAGARWLLDALEPAWALSPLIALAAELCELAVARVVGRELADRLLAVGVDRATSATGLPDVLRQGAAAIHLYKQAVLDARRGSARALQLMDVLAATVGDDMFMVLHGRWLGHAFQGRAEPAERLRRQAELITEDDVWRRRAVLYVEAELFALEGDLLGLGRTCEAIAELAARFPGFRPWLAWARAELHRLRGELAPAEAEAKAALELARAGEHRVYVNAAPLAAELRLLRGDAEGALRAACEVLASVARHDLDRSAAVAAERVRALAESARGDHAAASAAIARAFALAREHQYGGLPLAVLHESAARVALAAGQVQACTDALNALHGLLEQAAAPALIHAYEALREEAKQLAIAELPAAFAAAGGDPSSASQLVMDVRRRLSEAAEGAARALSALRLIIEDAGADEGYLFLFGTGGLFAAASSGGERGCAVPLSLAQRHLDFELNATVADLTTLPDFDAAANVPRSPDGAEAALSPVLLVHDAGPALALSGLVLLGAGTMRPKQPRAALVHAISHCLAQAGDSLPRTL